MTIFFTGVWKIRGKINAYFSGVWKIRGKKIGTFFTANVWKIRGDEKLEALQ